MQPNLMRWSGSSLWGGEAAKSEALFPFGLTNKEKGKPAPEDQNTAKSKALGGK